MLQNGMVLFFEVPQTQQMKCEPKTVETAHETQRNPKQRFVSHPRHELARMAGSQLCTFLTCASCICSDRAAQLCLHTAIALLSSKNTLFCGTRQNNLGSLVAFCATDPI